MDEQKLRDIEEVERRRPGDVARVRSLLRRSDALHNVIVAVEDMERDYSEQWEEDLEVLQVMLEEVNREFKRARQELGIPD